MANASVEVLTNGNKTSCNLVELYTNYLKCEDGHNKFYTLLFDLNKKNHCYDPMLSLQHDRDCADVNSTTMAFVKLFLSNSFFMILCMQLMHALEKIVAIQNWKSAMLCFKNYDYEAENAKRRPMHNGMQTWHTTQWKSLNECASSLAQLSPSIFVLWCYGFTCSVVALVIGIVASLSSLCFVLGQSIFLFVDGIEWGKTLFILTTSQSNVFCTI